MTLDPDACASVLIFGTALVRMFYGVSDDFGPIQPCRDFVVRLKATNQGVVLKEHAPYTHSVPYPRDGIFLWRFWGKSNWHLLGPPVQPIKEFFAACLLAEEVEANGGKSHELRRSF